MKLLADIFPFAIGIGLVLWLGMFLGHASVEMLTGVFG